MGCYITDIYDNITSMLSLKIRKTWPPANNFWFLFSFIGLALTRDRPLGPNTKTWVDNFYWYIMLQPLILLQSSTFLGITWHIGKILRDGTLYNHCDPKIPKQCSVEEKNSMFWPWMSQLSSQSNNSYLSSSFKLYTIYQFTNNLLW